MADRPEWRILVVDDNVQNVELLEAYLGQLDCEVITAFDGAEALQRARDANPDLILLDVMMPKVSGFEVCKQLKSDPATRDIPILMVTALHESADIERGVEAGTDDFLTKPIQKAVLLTRVRALLRTRHLHNQLQRTLAYLREVERVADSRPPEDEKDAANRS